MALPDDQGICKSNFITSYHHRDLDRYSLYWNFERKPMSKLWSNGHDTLGPSV